MQIRTHIQLLGIALGTLLAGSASAGEIITPPLAVSIGNHLACFILNADDEPQAVTTRFYSIGGTLLDERSDQIPPGDPLYDFYTAKAGVFPSYCGFEVEAKKKKFRTSACVQSTGGCMSAVTGR